MLVRGRIVVSVASLFLAGSLITMFRHNGGLASASRYSDQCLCRPSNSSTVFDFSAIGNSIAIRNSQQHTLFKWTISLSVQALVCAAYLNLTSSKWRYWILTCSAAYKISHNLLPFCLEGTGAWETLTSRFRNIFFPSITAFLNHLAQPWPQPSLSTESLQILHYYCCYSHFDFAL